MKTAGSRFLGSTSTRFECQTLGVTQSMGRVGSALDNAAAEALNSTLNVEYITANTSAPR